MHIRKQVTVLCGALGMLFSCSLRAQDISACNVVMTSGLREYSIANQSEVVLNNYYDSYCQSSTSSTSHSAGLGFGAVISMIPVNLTGTYSDDSQAQTNFCKNYSSNYQRSGSSSSYQEKIVQKGYDSFNQCVSAVKLGLGARHVVVSKAAVTLTFTAGVDHSVEVRSLHVDQKKITCVGSNGAGKITFSDDTKVTSKDNIVIHCDRMFTTNSSGDKIYDEGTIQVSGNFGNYDVYLPATQVVAERDATVIYQKLAELQKVLAVGTASVAATVPKNGGAPGTNTAFLDFTANQVTLDRTGSFKPGSPSYFLAPAEGYYHIDGAYIAELKQARTVDYFSFYLLKMTSDENDWTAVSGAYDYSASPQSTVSVNLHLMRGDKIALKVGNASGEAVNVTGTLSVMQLN
jgi:hypothetical protein